MMPSGSGAGEQAEPRSGKNDAHPPTGGAYTGDGGKSILGGVGPNYNYNYPIFNFFASNQPHARILADSLEHNHSNNRRALSGNMLNPSGQKFLADYLEAYRPDLYKAYIENPNTRTGAPAYKKVKITLSFINDIRKLN